MKSEIDKIREESRLETLAEFGNEYCVFDKLNKTVFRPDKESFIPTKFIWLLGICDNRMHADHKLHDIRTWAIQNNIKEDLCVVTIKEADKLLNE